MLKFLAACCVASTAAWVPTSGLTGPHAALIRMQSMPRKGRAQGCALAALAEWSSIGGGNPLHALHPGGKPGTLCDSTRCDGL